MKIITGLIVMLALGLAWAAPAAAQSSSHLPVAGYPAAHDVTGAHELPDPTLDHKVVFTIGGTGPAKTTTEVNPMLPLLARYVNTLADHGVPVSKRNLIVMLHQRSEDFDIVMSNQAFKKRYGTDNPNIEVIRALTEAGVEFRACGQGLAAREIAADQVNPDIQVDLWALTSIVNLQMRGFARVGN